ncbi:MAG TPA: hypothetical protein PKA00_17315 [Saprospiraceae bacterium]|nr:hypothetical protein [Saprospiraceae bacterium]HMQ84680.1 hypothetical protein [Saprospiraceae bacterium]
MKEAIRQFLLKQLFQKSLKEFEYQKKTIDDSTNQIKVNDYQLMLFNNIWKDVLRNNNYFLEQKNKMKLPGHFESWEEFESIMPVQTKDVIKYNQEEIYNKHMDRKYKMSTGGSSSEPFTFWSGENEVKVARINGWLGRSIYGIKPNEPVFLVWGHSHLLGSGINRWKNLFLQEMKDRIRGYSRVSAYNLSEQRLLNFIEELKHSKAKYLIGYSTAIEALANAILVNGQENQIYNLKTVIATAESFSTENSVNKIKKAFNCTVTMEYGCVETGPIAYSLDGDSKFTTFWPSYKLSLYDSAIEGKKEIHLTALYKRSLPLINYKIGDLTDGYLSENGLLLNKILGRINDHILAEDGSPIHSEIFSHALKVYSFIDKFQVIQEKNKDIILCLKINSQLPLNFKSDLLERLRKMHSGIPSDINIEITDNFIQSIAGKTKKIIRR